MSARFETPIAIRAYSERPRRKAWRGRRSSIKSEPSEWTLIFDCETSVDPSQRLHFGFFQVRHGETLEREGIFVNEETLPKSERTRLAAFAKEHAIELISVEEFRSKIFLKYGYVRRGTIVGFNLPFDLSRIATDHASARRAMRGGFSFDLTGRGDDPRVRVKHFNSHAALIDFGIPGEQDTYRTDWKRGLRVPAYRGHFVDVHTFAVALLSRPFSLQSLAAHLGVQTQKMETEQHGTVTKQYITYARADVQATWECFRELMRRYAAHGLPAGSDRILSEASLGKAYLQQMGIAPLLVCEPKFPGERFAQIFCAYYGGRAEVRIRRVVQEVLYCDFKSMYPTVNCLMGLWAFVIGHGMTEKHSTRETQRFLETVTLKHLQMPKTWKRLHTLVRVRPQDDILPVRAKYNGENNAIGLNRLTSSESLCYTLADCIVSKLLSGRVPRIEKAITYCPGPPQGDLVATRILNRDDFTIDPAEEDFFKRLVDLRDEAKATGSSAEKALKIIANSTSYGIFIEIIRDDAPKAERLIVFTHSGKKRRITTKAIEDPGSYFNPLLGALITGAARLMLGIAEKLTLDQGLDWAFCDTDSLAIARPSGMSRQQFHKRAQAVVDWFTPLNPYRKPGSILKVEDLNFGIASKRTTPLYCYAISAKRYVLINITDGTPIIRKASAHGLGHLLDPYPMAEAPKDIPAPAVQLSTIGVRRWQYDFWYRIIKAALEGHPDEVPLDWHRALGNPAAIRYSATSAEFPLIEPTRFPGIGPT